MESLNTTKKILDFIKTLDLKHKDLLLLDNNLEYVKPASIFDIDNFLEYRKIAIIGTNKTITLFDVIDVIHKYELTKKNQVVFLFFYNKQNKTYQYFDFYYLSEVTSF